MNRVELLQAKDLLKHIDDIENHLTTLKDPNWTPAFVMNDNGTPAYMNLTPYRAAFNSEFCDRDKESVINELKRELVKLEEEFERI